jgi:hypothetical protein
MQEVGMYVLSDHPALRADCGHKKRQEVTDSGSDIRNNIAPPDAERSCQLSAPLDLTPNGVCHFVCGFAARRGCAVFLIRFLRHLRRGLRQERHHRDEGDCFVSL